MAVVLCAFAWLPTPVAKAQSPGTAAEIAPSPTLYRVNLFGPNQQPVADLTVRAAGHSHLGVSHFTLPDGTGLVNGQDGPNGGGAWDCREWQWWRGYAGSTEMRPRKAPATCGTDTTAHRVRVWSEWLCDGVRTNEQWLFSAQSGTRDLHYDCVITVTNETGHVLREYGQFFASYTALNGKMGHWFWDASGKLVNFLEIGGRHIDRFIVDAAGPFPALGNIPHCPRGEGKVSGHWRRPVLVSHPSADGRRHIIMCEPRTTAGVTMGMNGIAMDYIVYPGELAFGAGQSFSTHVRHYFAALPEGRIVETLERLWAEFEASRAAVRHSIR